MNILGIDIGGSGIKGCPVDTKTGQMLGERFRLETPEGRKPNGMMQAIEEIIEHFDWKGPVGCGYPGVIRKQKICTAANLNKDWIGLDLAKLISKKTQSHAWVLNDADAAGIAEMRYGIGREHSKDVVILITVGTGLGTAVFTQGNLLPNTELGHIKIRGKEAEKRASGAVRKLEDLSWKQWSKRFDTYLNLMHSLFWPDVFIIGGGIVEKAEHFLPLLTVKTPVKIAQMGNQAGIIGAAIAAEEAMKR
jgi:polyphosphate glucokinase